MTMKPAYLGDAKLGDTVRFQIPETATTMKVYEGTLWMYERDNTHVPHPVIRVVVAGHVADGVLVFSPNLHIDLDKGAQQ